MGILQQWRDKAYNEKANRGDIQRLWSDYFKKEKEIYAEILKKPEEVVTGTVTELAEKFNVDLMTMTGFLDGINDSLKEANPIEEMDENTVVNLGFDTEKLYKNMVAAGADWLYELEEWEPIFSEEKRKELFLQRGEEKRTLQGAEGERHCQKARQDLSQRSLPLWIRQEIQEVPRKEQVRLCSHRMTDKGYPSKPNNDG